MLARGVVKLGKSLVLRGNATVPLALSMFGLAFTKIAYCSGQTQTDNSASKPKIYQYLICPFCNRVKSYLDFCGIEYETVEVNPLTKAEISFPTSTKKVPIAIMNNVVVEDSNNIIDAISKHVKSSNLLSIPNESFFPDDTDKWNEWSEKKLAVMLYPNITRSFDESWECFSYSSKVESWSAVQKVLVRTIGPAAMFLANGKIKKKYGIVDERKELKEVLAVWCDALQGQNFLHGDHITMPDLLVFGVLRSIQGLRTFNEIMDETPVLKEWYDRVYALTPSREVKKLQKI